eukprot:g19132.t1
MMETANKLAARLLLACKAGQLQVVTSLLESGRGRPDGGGWTPLTSVEVEGTSGDWHYWRERACDYDPTPLHEAASRGNVEIVRALFAAIARRNPRASTAKSTWVGLPTSPMSLLPSAAKNDVPGIVATLLRAGLDPTEADEHRMTPLHYAAEGGHEEVARLLLQAGAEVDSTSPRERRTSLHVASRCARVDYMLELLRWGANLNALCVLFEDDFGLESGDDDFYRDAEECVSGEEGGGKRPQRSVLISAMVKIDEDEDKDEDSTSDDTSDKTTTRHVLDGLMRLGTRKESPFSQVNASFSECLPKQAMASRTTDAMDALNDPSAPAPNCPNNGLHHGLERRWLGGAPSALYPSLS